MKLKMLNGDIKGDGPHYLALQHKAAVSVHLSFGEKVGVEA